MPTPDTSRRMPHGLVRQHAIHRVVGASTASVLRHAGLRQGMRVADIGCGVGLVTSELARAVGEGGLAVGIDADPAHLRQAQELVARSGTKNAWFDQGDVYDTGLPRSSFDLVFCRGGAGRAERPGDVITELVALLAPGGVLVCEELEAAPAGPVMLPGGRSLEAWPVPQGSAASVAVPGIGAWLPSQMRERGLARIGVSFCRPVTEALAESIAGGILDANLALWQTWGWNTRDHPAQA